MKFFNGLTMRISLTIFSFFIIGVGTAQDLTGIWRGIIETQSLTGMQGDRYQFEVQINHQNTTVTGVTYSYKEISFYGKSAFTGTFSTATGKMVLEENKILEVRAYDGSNPCTMTCFLDYSRSGGEELLTGTFTAGNPVDSSYCGRGKMILRKVTNSDFYKEPFLAKDKNQVPNGKINNTIKDKTPGTTKPGNGGTGAVKRDSIALVKGRKLDAPVVPDGYRASPSPLDKKPEITAIPPVLKSRSNELVRVLEFPAGEIKIRLYDNGEIDNDIISVYHNNREVISKQKLLSTPIRYSLILSEDQPAHELIMVAETLGDIPPNTSLMIVEAGRQTFEVRITSTDQKNAKVIFRLKSGDR